MTPSSSAQSVPDPGTELLRKALLDHWDIRAEALHLLQERDGQYVYEVQGTGSFILKVYPLSVQAERLQNNATVMDHLYLARFPAPVVRRNTSGEAFHTGSRHRMLVQSWIPGNAPRADRQSMVLLGTLSARLHLLPVPPVASSIDPAALRSSMFDRARQYGMPALYHELVAALPDLSTLPRALIHTDLELRNMIVTETGNASLIDWDDAGEGIALLDVVYPLVTLLQENGAYDEALYRSFYEAYTTLRPLTMEERQLFHQAVAFWLLFYSIVPEVGVIGSNWTKAQAWVCKAEVPFL